MKKKIFRWLKFIGLLAAAAVCLCMILLELIFVVPEYGAWQFHAPVKQLYEDMDSFFIGVSFLILCSGFFLISVNGIVRLRKSERAPSPIWRRSRNYILFISLILFAVSTLWGRDVAAKMNAIIEDGEAPMAYRLHLLQGWLSIVQTLTFWGFLVPLYSWSKDQEAAWTKMAAEKAKNPPVGDFGKEGSTMGLLGKLFKRKDSKDIMEKPEIPKVQTAEDPPLTQWVTCGRGEPVYFIDESRGIQKPIVDFNGNICNFPGFAQEDLWFSQAEPCYLKTRIRFGASFERRDNRLIMLWKVQPDGRYWEDEDGFGGTSDAEVTLYTFLNENGDFTGPFRVYRIGTQDYYGKDIMEKPQIPKVQTAEDPPLTRWETFGRGEPVYFIDESRGIQKPIVDYNGNICNFPGFAQEDLWVSQVDSCYLKPLIRFCTSFGRRDNRLIMRWEIQPDGRYWADEDGFGGTSDEEVTLYTFLDENGDFTGPFRVYSIGTQDYYKPEV